MSRIRANTITNQNANGAPNFPDGITVTGIVTATTTSQNITGTLAVTGDATFSGNVGIAGIVTGKLGAPFAFWLVIVFALILDIVNYF